MIEFRDRKWWQLGRALGTLVLGEVMIWATILVVMFVIGSFLLLAG